MREPADAAARSASLVRSFVAALPPTRPLRIVDLGAGTGANARYLSDRLPSPQDWLLVDRDAGLLARTAEPVPFDTQCADLDELVALPFGVDLVTASALLDLVSERWLRALVDRCRECGAAVLFALAYDGRIQCVPEEPGDEMIRGLVNRHQRTDKGLGPALGPDAPRVAARCFTDAGYAVRRERSDWVLTSESAELQRQLIDGWASAATEVDPARATTIEEWRRRRLAHVAAGGSQLVVGHEDLLAIPSAGG